MFWSMGTFSLFLQERKSDWMDLRHGWGLTISLRFRRTFCSFCFPESYRKILPIIGKRSRRSQGGACRDNYPDRGKGYPDDYPESPFFNFNRLVALTGAARFGRRTI